MPTPRTTRTPAAPPEPAGPALRVDRLFSGGLRIARTIGSSDPADLAVVNAALDACARTNALREVLIAVRDGVLTMHELRTLHRTNALADGIAGARIHRPLVSELERCLPMMGTKERVRRGYVRSLSQLVIAGQVSGQMPANATVGDLRDVADWKAVRNAFLGDRGDRRTGRLSGATWNNAVVALGSFLSLVTGDVHSPVRRAVMSKVDKLPVGSKRKTDASVAEVLAAIKRMPRYTGAAALMLLVAGLRKGELFALRPEHLKPNARAVDVQGAVSEEDSANPEVIGTKSAGSAGWVPVPHAYWDVMVSVVHNMPDNSSLRRHWCLACHAVGLGVVTLTPARKGGKQQSFTYTGLRLHDLRHLWAITAHDAGATVTEVQLGLRHESAETTQLYLAHSARASTAAKVGAAMPTFDAAAFWAPIDESAV